MGRRLVDPLDYFSSQPVLHDWCSKGRGMYYPVCAMVHIKDTLLLIRKSSPRIGNVYGMFNIKDHLAANRKE